MPNIKIVIAPQSFKAGLTGANVAKAIEQGVLAVFPTAETVKIPVADGGDGTLEALVGNTGGRYFDTRVTGPLGLPVSASWGVMGDGSTAVVEMAQASGLALVPLQQRDPRITTTYGTGEIILEVLNKGYRRIIIGLGGSATNDGGVGMAQALGVKFLDHNGKDLAFGGKALSRLARIDISDLHIGVSEAEVTAAADVTNSLCGPTGASLVYGPQKRGTPDVIRRLDEALEHFSQVVKRDLGIDVKDVPGAGAAGGLGAGLIAFLDGEIRLGIDLVSQVLGLKEKLEGADMVITGEGRLDASSVFDKAPIGVARMAKANNTPVIVMAGSLGQGYRDVYEHGIDAVVPILDRPMRFDESIARTRELLTEATERTMRLLQLGQTISTADVFASKPSA